MSLTVLKLQFVCVLPYTGKFSLDLRTRLRRTIEKNIPFCKLNVVFRSICRLGNLFRFKYSLEKKSSLEQSTPTRLVTAGYLLRRNVPKNFNRASEHMETSNLTGKRLKNAKELALSDNLLQCDSTITFDDFDILVSYSNKFKLLIQESLFIKRDKPATKSFPLDLFDQVLMVLMFTFDKKQNQFSIFNKKRSNIYEL